MTARGALRVGAHRVTHHGRTVTARLAVQLPGRLAGRTLAAKVGATDVDGHRQPAEAVRVVR